jgi:hypothetical protein
MACDLACASVVEVNFDKEDAAYFLSHYVRKLEHRIEPITLPLSFIVIHSSLKVWFMEKSSSVYLEIHFGASILILTRHARRRR